MIQVELKDFEKYRKRLLSYAIALLKTKGSANTLYSELEEKAKDIVQESYLVFHECNLNAFVNETHLYNFLKLVLYKKYQNSIQATSKANQYSIFKIGELDKLSLDTKYGYNYEGGDDHIDNFLKTLTTKQKDLLNKLLEGFNGAEISKELGISRQAINSSLSWIKKKYEKYEKENSKSTSL